MRCNANDEWEKIDRILDGDGLYNCASYMSDIGQARWKKRVSMKDYR